MAERHSAPNKRPRQADSIRSFGIGAFIADFLPHSSPALAGLAATPERPA